MADCVKTAATETVQKLGNKLVSTGISSMI